MADEYYSPVLVNEHEAGICGMTASMETSYKQSCEHNNKTPEDVDYFRSYVWALLATLVQRIEGIEERLDRRKV